MAIITLNPMIQSIHGKMDSIVFVHRKGTQFIRQYVVPHDPKTESQLKNRSNFANLVASWKKLPQIFRDSWNRYGETMNRTGYNLFISENMKARTQGEKLHLVKAQYLKVNGSALMKALKGYYNKLILPKSTFYKQLIFLDTVFHFPMLQ